MKSSMVIWGGATGAAAGGVVGGVAVVVGAVEVDGEGIDGSLTGFTPGFDSIRGKSDGPLWMMVPGFNPPHSTVSFSRGLVNSAEMPS
jgi:hypothetical protein